jgi:hypothetical protein
MISVAHTGESQTATGLFVAVFGGVYWFLYSLPRGSPGARVATFLAPTLCLAFSFALDWGLGKIGRRTLPRPPFGASSTRSMRGVSARLLINGCLVGFLVGGLLLAAGTRGPHWDLIGLASFLALAVLCLGMRYRLPRAVLVCAGLLLACSCVCALATGPMEPIGPALVFVGCAIAALGARRMLRAGRG